jgi:hypothetical protein
MLRTIFLDAIAYRHSTEFRLQRQKNAERILLCFLGTVLKIAKNLSQKDQKN